MSFASDISSLKRRVTMSVMTANQIPMIPRRGTSSARTSRSSVLTTSSSSSDVSSLESSLSVSPSSTLSAWSIETPVEGVFSLPRIVSGAAGAEDWDQREETLGNGTKTVWCEEVRTPDREGDAEAGTANDSPCSEHDRANTPTVRTAYQRCLLGRLADFT